MFIRTCSIFQLTYSDGYKGPINPPSHNKSYIHVIIDAFSHFVVTVPIKSNNAKTAIKTLLHHWIIKFGPPCILLLIADQTMSIKKWHIFVHLWELDTLPEQLIPLEPMVLLKYKTEILAHTFECSSTTLLKIGVSKFTCMLMHINHNLFQNSMFRLMKLYFTQNYELPLPLT